MSKVDRLCKRLDPFAAMFWALGIVLYYYLPTSDTARRPGITAPPYVVPLSLYGQSWLNSE